MGVDRMSGIGFPVPDRLTAAVDHVDKSDKGSIHYGACSLLRSGDQSSGSVLRVLHFFFVY